MFKWNYMRELTFDAEISLDFYEKGEKDFEGASAERTPMRALITVWCKNKPVFQFGLTDPVNLADLMEHLEKNEVIEIDWYEIEENGLAYKEKY